MVSRGMSRAGSQRKKVIDRTRRKMQVWRDKARLKFLEQRRRIKLRVRRNASAMEERKKDREEGLNPLALSTMPESRRLLKYPASHSTLPEKPRYSSVEPRERLYGNKWLKLGGRKNG